MLVLSALPAMAGIYCSEPGLAITDNDPFGITDTLSVEAPWTITDLDSILEIPHTWVGDLIVELEHVSTGTQMVLVDRTGFMLPSTSCSGQRSQLTARRMRGPSRSKTIVSRVMIPLRRIC